MTQKSEAESSDSFLGFLLLLFILHYFQVQSFLNIKALRQKSEEIIFKLNKFRCK